jgi:hypothetical protein
MHGNEDMSGRDFWFSLFRGKIIVLVCYAGGTRYVWLRLLVLHFSGRDNCSCALRRRTKICLAATLVCFPGQDNCSWALRRRTKICLAATLVCFPGQDNCSWTLRRRTKRYVWPQLLVLPFQDYCAALRDPEKGELQDFKTKKPSSETCGFFLFKILWGEQDSNLRRSPSRFTVCPRWPLEYLPG